MSGERAEASEAPRERRAGSAASALASRIRDGDRRSLARAITLVESTRPDHRVEATELLTELLPDTGKSIRLGITGTPGSGKSTFIEALGLHLTGRGQRVAVLAVDPSSTRTGGSILGDKTRMEELTRDPDAFIRPTPTGGTLGGVARRTREALLLCEAAGFDVVVVETVGVGQSEVAVGGMVDCFLLLLAPGGGDELQGIKRGVVELADLVVVNKADGALRSAAEAAAADYAAALHLLRPRAASWAPRVVVCSALEGRGIDAVWEAVDAFRAALEPTGELARRRAEQAKDWMWAEVTETVLEGLRRDERVAAIVADLEDRVAGGSMTPGAAATRILEAYRPS